jgi:hypothetical protein
MYVKPVTIGQIQLQIRNYCLTGQETMNIFVGKVGHFVAPCSSNIYPHVKTAIQVLEHNRWLNEKTKQLTSVYADGAFHGA